ncbi:unnamed protein product [Closterium sp. NIES-54]
MLSPRYWVTVEETVSERSRCSSPSNQVVMSSAMYALTDSAEGDCYLSVPPDPGIKPAALGASASAAPGTGESAAPGAGESALSGTAPSEALHTFTLDSSASRSFFHDSTTLTPLSRPVAVSLADPSRGPVLAHSSTALPCPAAPSGLLSGIHLPSFSTNLVSGADLQEAWVDQFAPGGQRVTHCTCSRTGRHLATFTRRPGISMYTLTTAPPPVPASGQLAASSKVFVAASRSSPASAPCSCRPLSHETLLWHHRLGHPSLPRLRGMASLTLVSGLPRSLPPLPPRPAPTCVPFVEGRQRAAPHSSTSPPTEAPLQTLHMDVWGPARVRGQGHEHYFLLVVDDYSRYTTVFPLHSKGEVPEVLIDWIRGARRQLSERFGSDLPVLRLHTKRGGEFSSDLVRAICRAEGIRQTFTLPASPQQNGIAERRIGMVMDVARTSMIHAAAPHFLWPFAVQYAAHQINLQPHVSLPETTPTLRWTGKVGDASAFRVWGSRAFVRDTSADKLSSRAGPAPSGVSQVDPAELVEVAVDSGAARGAEPAGAGIGGAEPGGAEPGGTTSGGAEPTRAESGGSPDVPLRRKPLSLQQLREWYARCCHCATGAAGGATGAGAGATGGAAGAGAAGGAAGAGAPGGAAGAGATGGAAGAGAAGGATGGGAAGAGDAGPGGARTGGTGAAGPGGAAGVVTGDPGAEGNGAVSAISGGAARPRPYYVPLLQQVLGLPPSPGPTPPLLSPPPVQSQLPLQPSSPPPGPSPYSGPTGGLTERREPESRHVSPVSRSASPVRTARTGRRTPRPPPVHGTHSMTLRPSTAPQRVPLPSPPMSSLRDGLDPESDSLRAASPAVTRFLATAVTDPLFESTSASAIVDELVDFAAACRQDYSTSLVAESSSASVCPPSVGGECALGTDVLEDRQEEFECFAAPVPHLVSMLLAPEGDPDAPDILTPRSYAEAIEGPYSSQWQAAMDTEMASWKSTGTYVDEVPPPGANIVSGMWIFRVKRPPGSPPVFKARYVARGFNDLVFATADTEALVHVKSELQKRHTCTDLGELTSYLGLRITRDRAQCTITLTLSHMVQQVLQRFGFTYSSPQSTPLPTGHSLSAAPSDESVEPSGPYPELVGCLMYLMTCTRPDLGYPLSLLARYVAPGRHRKVHWDAAKRVLRYLCSTSGMGLVLGGRARLVLTGHADASWVDDLATQRSSHDYTFNLGSGSVSWRSTRSSSILSSNCEAEIYAWAMAAQELRWLTYLLTDLGEAPRSPLVLYIDNKAMLALCQEHRTKHIALRYFLARELQHCGQLRLVIISVSVDPLPLAEPVEVTVDSGAAKGGAARRAASRGAEPAGAEPGGAESASAEPGGFESKGAEPGGAGGPAAGGTGAGGTRAAEAGGVGDPGAGDAGAGGAGAGGTVAGDPGARGTGARHPRAGGTGAGGAGAGGAGARDTGAGGAGGGVGSTGARGTVHQRPFFIPTPPSSLPPPSSTPHCVLLLLTLSRQTLLWSIVSLSLVLPCLFALFALVVVFLVRVLLLSPALTLWHLVLPVQSPPGSSLADGPDPESDLVCAASPTVTRLLATVVTDPSFESAAASALVAEPVDSAATCRLDYAASLVAESESDCPPSVGGECALSTDVLEDRHEDFECLAAAVTHLVAMLLAPEGDPDAPDIPTLQSYVEAITGPYSSQWQTAMDAEMAS